MTIFDSITEGAAQVAIVAGGPSLIGVDLSRLSGPWVTIAVNEAAVHLPFRPHYAFTIDSAILRTRFPFYPAMRHVAAVPSDYLSPDARKKGWREPPVSPIDGLLLLERCASDRLPHDRWAIGHNSNSGSGAISLAWHLLRNAAAAGAGPLDLFLFGFDHTALDRYWHGAGRVCDRPWATSHGFYDNAAAQLRGIGARVWHASPDSAIQAWPRHDPRAVLRAMDALRGASCAA
jgi:hypothetical protein